MAKKYYYHLVSHNKFKVGDTLEIGTRGNGMWHDIYESNQMKELTDKDRIIEEYDFIVRELAAEEVRKEEFPNLPSRLKCLYICDNIENCKKRVEKFKGLNVDVTQIIKISLSEEPYAVNAKLFPKIRASYNEYKEYARNFFKSMKKGGKSEDEYLFVGTLTVEEVFEI